MRLNNSSKTMVFGNINLIRYCHGAGISLDKLKKCNIEKMGNTYVFVLSKENMPKSNSLIPLDVDIATQPDVVLTMEVLGEENINFGTTDKTLRILVI